MTSTEPAQNYPFQSYRGWIGHPEGYDVLAINQFTLLGSLGLRARHKVLDIGCGSLRLGRLLIPFLEAGNYHGVEPEMELVNAGIEKELGWDAIKIKNPKILPVRDFSLSRFGATFDYVIAHSIFTHTQPDLAVKALKAVSGVLSRSGYFACTFISRSKPIRPASEGWIYPDCLAYTPSEIQALFDLAGLRILPEQFPHPDQDWVIARRT